MKPTQSEELNNLKAAAQKIREEMKGLRSQLVPLAAVPSQENQAKAQAIQVQIETLKGELKAAEIAVKQKEIELLEQE